MLTDAELQAIESALRSLPPARELEPSRRILAQLLADLDVEKEPFTYVQNFQALAGGTNATVITNIQADAPFVIHQQSYAADIAVAVQTDSTRVIPIVTALITDGSSGRQFMDADVPLPCLFGESGSLPYILPNPKVLAARSTLSTRLTNLTAATSYNIRLCFHGLKLYSLKRSR